MVRKAGEAEPGFCEGDTVEHCGPTLKGESARTPNLTRVHTGWVSTRSIRHNTHKQVLAALEDTVGTVPFEVVGLDYNGMTRTS